MRHPRERWPIPSGLSRRDFLKRSATTAIALSGGGILLSACGEDASAPGGSASVIRVASPENPATLRLYDDNQAVESGLEPEAGPLKIFNWSDYVWPKVVKDFAATYDVDFEITTFHNMAEGVAKLRTGQLDFDVFFPTIDVLPKLAAAKLLQPLNHDYLPNLQANVWPQLADPFYDRGSRYSVPYVVYTTGIGYRTDMVTEDVAALDNPYDIFWNPDYSGKVGIYDDYREAMSMVLLRNDHTDLNTDDPSLINETKNDLIDLVDLVNVRTTIAGAYAKLPEGEFGVHQAWSGDLVAAPYYMPRGGDPKVLRYWWPTDGKGTIGSDTMAIPSNARNPVLAHLFLNFLLDNVNAIRNFGWVGYQPPMTALEPRELIKDGYVLETLEPAIVTESAFDTGYYLLALPPAVDALWQDAWSEFKSGA